MKYRKLTTGMAIVLATGMFGAVPTPGKAAGWGQGYIAGDHLFFDGERSIYHFTMDSGKTFTDVWGNVGVETYSDFNSDGECGDSVIAMVDMTDTTIPIRKELYFELKLAIALKRPISESTSGCVSLYGSKYARVVGVDRQ